MDFKQKGFFNVIGKRSYRTTERKEREREREIERKKRERESKLSFVPGAVNGIIESSLKK
jgi:hypothetical protein